MRKQLNGYNTVLDVGCGDGDAMAAINADKKYRVTGIDLYEPYLEKAKQSGVYYDVKLGDVRSLNISDKSYDVAFSSQVVEHLEKHEALALIKEMERIAKHLVIVATTNGFYPYDPIQGKDDNPLQVHKCGWDINEMKGYGYHVYGQGLGIIYKPTGLAHRTKNKTIQRIGYLLSYLAAPIVYILPQLSAYIITVKKI